MRILSIIQKDLLQIIRDRKSLFFFILMPALFTAFMGFALQSGSSPDKTTSLPVAWLNQDGDSPIAAALRAGLAAGATLDLQDAQGQNLASLEQQVKDGSLAAVIVLPAGFNRSLTGDQTIPLQVILDPATTQGQAVQSALQASLAGLANSREIARLVQPAGGPAQASVLQSAFQGWQNPGYTLVSQASGPLVLDNAYNQSSPGMMVMFAIFGLTSSALVLVNERRANTLQRMLSGGVSTAEVILGHTLAMFVVVFLQSTLLIALGQAIFQVNYLGHPAATFLALAALALWVSALGLLIGAVSKSAEQVTMLGMLAMFLLAALGGAMFPLDFAGNAFITLGRLLPSSWAMAGFQDVLVRGYTLRGILPALAIQAGFAALFLFLAVFRFKKAGAAA